MSVEKALTVEEYLSEDYKFTAFNLFISQMSLNKTDFITSFESLVLVDTTIADKEVAY